MTFGRVKIDNLHPRALAALLVGWVMVWCVFVLKTPFHWWFEDDTEVYGFVAAIHNPLSFFFDRSVLLSYQKVEVIPFQHLSLWIDYFLAPQSAAFCYVHSIVSLMLAAYLLFKVVERAFGSAALAFGVGVLWTILPSTVATHEFLSARCYVEGLIFSLGALLLCLPKEDEGKPLSWGRIAGISTLMVCAVLSKEFYPTTTLPMVFLIGAARRQISLMASAVGVAIFYAAYRIYMVGHSVEYGMPFVETKVYLVALARVPRFFSGNVAGYALFAVAVLAGLYAWYRDRDVRRRTLLLLASTLALALATLYPITQALILNEYGLGTWARSPFVVNTIALVLGAAVVSTIPLRYVRVGAFVAGLLVVGHGAWMTFTTWDALKVDYEREGKFLLQEPPKLLYTRLPAPWFMDGLGKLYPQIRRRYIDARWAMNDRRTVAALEGFTTLWRSEGGVMVEDAKLFGKVLRGSRLPSAIESARIQSP